MPYPEITRATATIHNPSDPRHFMRLKPVARQVTVMLDGKTLAQTRRGIRLVEVSNDVYDPVIYIPRADIVSPLQRVPGRTSHCPLKGDASYYAVEGWMPSDDKDYLAWSYDAPFDFARELAGLIAFNSAWVSVTEAP